MGGEGLASTTRVLVLGLSVLYLVSSLVGIFVIDLGSSPEAVAAIALLVAGAALMLVGQFLLAPGRRSAVLVSAAAAIGGLPLVWTFLVPVAVALVITCSVALARRPASA